MYIVARSTRSRTAQGDRATPRAIGPWIRRCTSGTVRHGASLRPDEVLDSSEGRANFRFRTGVAGLAFLSVRSTTAVEGPAGGVTGGGG